MKSIYSVLVPKLEWWSFELPTVKFTDEVEIGLFMNQCHKILDEFEANCSLEVTPGTDLHKDFRNQSKPLATFFVDYEMNYKKYDATQMNCVIRAQRLKDILSEEFKSSFNIDDNMWCIASSTNGNKEADVLEAKGAALDTFFIRNYSPHCCLFLNIEVNGRKGRVFFEMIGYLERPTLIFEGEQFKVEWYNGVTSCSFTDPRYIMITRTVNDKFVYSFCLFVGGNFKRPDLAVKLACLPRIPFRKIFVRNRVIVLTIKPYFTKPYFVFEIVEKLGNTFNETVTRNVNVPVEYFLGQMEKVEGYEREIDIAAKMFQEPRDKTLGHLKDLAEINQDKDYLNQVQELSKNIKLVGV